MTIRDRVLSFSVLVARALLGGIFLIAALNKVQAPGAFADAIRAFHLLPAGLVLPVAFTLPLLELLLAAYLLAGFMTRLAAAGATALLLVFVVALGNSLLSGDTNHACGCFGDAGHANPVLAFLSGGSTITWWDLIRDILLVGLACLVFVRGAGRQSLDALLGRQEYRPSVQRAKIAQR